MSDPKLADYDFLFLKSHYNQFIYSIEPFLRKLPNVPYTHLNLNTDSVIYRDGKFVVTNYKHDIQSLLEGIINCAIFVITVFNSFRIKLIKTEEFPPICSLGKKFILEDWLNAANIIEKEEYRQYHIELRGKHVFYVPLAKNVPVSYAELNNNVDDLVGQLFLRHP